MTDLSIAMAKVRELNEHYAKCYRVSRVRCRDLDGDRLPEWFCYELAIPMMRWNERRYDCHHYEKRLFTRWCTRCDEQFVTDGLRTQLCSDSCEAASRKEAWQRQAAKRKEGRAWRKKHPGDFERTFDRKCGRCGRVLYGFRKTIRYCDTACRVAAHRKTKTAAPTSVGAAVS